MHAWKIAWTCVLICLKLLLKHLVAGEGTKAIPYTLRAQAEQCCVCANLSCRSFHVKYENVSRNVYSKHSVRRVASCFPVFETPGGVLGFIWGGMFVSSSSSSSCSCSSSSDQVES